MLYFCYFAKSGSNFSQSVYKNSNLLVYCYHSSENPMSQYFHLALFFHNNVSIFQLIKYV